MEPYYSDALITLYLGDCREVTDWLEADVLITDPPYGIDGALSASYRGKKRAAGFAPVHDRAVTWDATLEARDAAITLWGEVKPAAVFASPKRMDAPPFAPRQVPLIWDIKAPPGVIADPFTGSGSTLVAAKHEGRKAIGIEMDERYCEIAAKRLCQDTLFGGVA